MQKSKIEWTEATWNPVRGCSRVSPGCVNCYAERIAGRFCGKSHFPFFGFATKKGWTGSVDVIEEKLADPLGWRKPRTIFVNSMSDLFHEKLPDEAIDRVFAVMALCPQHRFFVLTKRAKRMREWATARPDPGTRLLADMIHLTGNAEYCYARQWPLPNVGLGVSCEDQQRADERIPELLRTPAAMRFVSLEPLLGAIQLFPDGAFTDRQKFPMGFAAWSEARRSEWFEGTARATYMARQTGIDWVIVGGESGPGARPMDVSWVRSIVAQCKAAGVPVFVKQLGAKPVSQIPCCAMECGCGFHYGFRNRKGGDPSEWPEDLRVRELPKFLT